MLKNSRILTDKIIRPSARIALISASLNKGGVADHVKALAAELTSRGETTITLSRQDCAQGMPDHLEWIGLHFVSYAWANQGILRSRDIEELRTICSGKKVALYLHELWIGEHKGSSIKHRLIGALQRRRILRLISVLKPGKIFTSNRVYQAILAADGVSSELIPLAGNLASPTDADHRSAQDWLANAGLGHEPPQTIAAIFGTIHPEWDATEALKSWHAHHKNEGRNVAILTMGNHGIHGKKWITALRANAPELRITTAGEQPATLLSGLLAQCGLGLASSPWALIHKSGTAAAFIEAGLPVVVTRDDWRWRRGNTPDPRTHPQLWKYLKTSPFPWAACLASRGEPAPQAISQVADQWIQQLSRSQDSPQ